MKTDNYKFKRSTKTKKTKSRSTNVRPNPSYEEKDSARVDKRYNDPMWYAKNEQMLRDAASYSYNNPIGSPLPNTLWSGGANTGVSVIQNNTFVPSLMSIRVAPTIGVSTDSSSPANLAANNIYAYVRYMNSGSKNYDQADLMLYLLAMDSLYACWNWMKRIYGYMNMYSQYNRTMPRVFARADQVGFDSIQSSLADFRLFLNRTAAQISSFCVPAVMPYFIRHSWMFSNIYKDSDNNKAQMYMFVPEWFYMYSETSSQYGGELIPMFLQKDGEALTINSLNILETYLTDLINAVAYSEDIGVMSGDILKAYGQEKLFKLSPVEPDYTVQPVYNEEVLNQIHNSRAVPGWYDNANQQYYKITQNADTGYLIWKPSIQITVTQVTNSAVQPSGFLVNMPWDDVTPANTMVGTRLIGAYEWNTTGSTTTLTITECGSEIVTGYNIFTSYLTAGSIATAFKADSFKTNLINTGDSGLTAANFAALMARISNFDWHPLFTSLDVSGTTATASGVYGDISNYTYMSLSDISKLNLTALMSEFNIPQLGSF